LNLPISEDVELDERLYVASVAKAMRVLEAFDQSSQQLSIADITEMSGLGRSATQRFVYTLHRLGYLRRDPASKLYSVSAKVFRFVHGMIGANAALERSYPLLSQLAKDTRETVSWVELDGDEIVVIGNIPSVHLASITLSVGSRFAALSSSSGQVLLCRRGEAELRAMIARLPDAARARFGGQSDEDILAMLGAIGETGYSLTAKSFDEDSLSISAPVLDYAGRPVAAINLSTLASRYTERVARKELVPLVVAAAKAASSL
jgi:IclR family pca regulon transcriptional regulator